MIIDGIKDFFRRLKGLFKRNFYRSVAEIANSSSVTSEVMMNAIDIWLDMFSGNAEWLKDNPQSLCLPAIIASEIARSVTVEMEVKISGSQMADYINTQFDNVRSDIRSNTEYACAGGGIVFKPYISPDGKNIGTEIIQANAFFPIAYSNAQKITAAYFIYRHWDGRKIYSRLEKHELKGTKYIITNKAYVSTNDESLGSECSLGEVEEWQNIQPETYLDGVEKPLFSYFKIPIGNTIDFNSPLGVSVYARAVGLIRDADLQYQRLMWEYEGGELAIDASKDAFTAVDGVPVLPSGKERLYRTNNIDPITAGSGELLKAWSPSLRDSNYIAGLNRLLIQIEDACSLARGTLSDPSQVDKTATEIISTKQRSYVTVHDIQASLETALDDLVYAMYCIAILYDLCPDGSYTTNYVWDDSIIVDAEAERLRDQQEVAQGLMQAYEYRMKWRGEDEATAKKMVGYTEEKTDDEILGFGNEGDVDDGEMSDNKKRKDNGKTKSKGSENSKEDEE